MRLTFIAGAVLVLSASAALTAAKMPTIEDARQFLSKVESALLVLSVDAGRADWIKSTFITDDTEVLSAKLDQASIDATVKFAKEAAPFDRIALPPIEQRKLKLLKNSLELATPSDPAEAAEVTRLAASLEGAYGKGKYCPDARQVPGSGRPEQDHGKQPRSERTRSDVDRVARMSGSR